MTDLGSDARPAIRRSGTLLTLFLLLPLAGCSPVAVATEVSREQVLGTWNSPSDDGSLTLGPDGSAAYRLPRIALGLSAVDGEGAAYPAEAVGTTRWVLGNCSGASRASCVRLSISERVLEVLSDGDGLKLRLQYGNVDSPEKYVLTPAR